MRYDLVNIVLTSVQEFHTHNHVRLLAVHIECVCSLLRRTQHNITTIFKFEYLAIRGALVKYKCSEVLIGRLVDVKTDGKIQNSPRSN